MTVNAAALIAALQTFESGTLWHNPDLGKPNHPCKGYADANATEADVLDKWIRELASTGAAPPLPTLATATGRGLAGMLAALAGAAPTPTPTPTTGSHVGNGYVTDLQGSRYTQMTDVERAHYGGITVGFGNETDVANFEKTHADCHGFGYQTSVEVGTNLWYGAVLVDVCRQNGWLLKDAQGAEVTNGYGLCMADIGHPGYRQAWCDAVATRAAATGLKRKFLDNVTGTMMVGAALPTARLRARPMYAVTELGVASERVSATTHRYASWFSRTPINPRTKVPYTDATWQTDYLGFLAFQQQHLTGFYRLANCYSSDRLAWWKAVAPFVDGLMLEYYDGSDSHNACLAACVAAGRDPWVLVDPSHAGQPSPDDPVGVALAHKFQVATAGRKGGGFGFVGVNMWRAGAGSWTAQIT